jgi:hypothetical protein
MPSWTVVWRYMDRKGGWYEGTCDFETEDRAKAYVHNMRTYGGFRNLTMRIVGHI